MTMETIVLQDSLIPLPDKNRLVKVLKRECFRMQYTIFSFCEPFGYELMGKVTIYTSGHGMMACFLPGIELRLHDMTVHTCRRVTTEVGESFPIVERKDPQPEKHAAHDRDDRAPFGYARLGISWYESMAHKSVGILQR